MPNDPRDDPRAGLPENDRGLKLRMVSEARRVQSQHVQIQTQLTELRRTFETGTAQMARSAFEAFADAIDAHMRVEETLYFPALHGLMPEVDPELIALREEHVELRRHIDGIRASLSARNDPEARSELDRLADRTTTHEAVEEALIRRVRDVGD